MTYASDSPPKRPKSRFINWTIALIGLVWLGVQLRPVWLEHGPETTVIIEPVREDGTVDNAAAMNAECSEGETIDNNAVVVRVPAMGPKTLNADNAVSYFRELGIDRPPDDGVYLQTLEQL